MAQFTEQDLGKTARILHQVFEDRRPSEEASRLDLEVPEGTSVIDVEAHTRQFATELEIANTNRSTRYLP